MMRTAWERQNSIGNFPAKNSKIFKFSELLSWLNPNVELCGAYVSPNLEHQGLFNYQI